MDGEGATAASCPLVSTCKGLSTVMFRSETSFWDSNIAPRMWSNSLRRMSGIQCCFSDIVVVRWRFQEWPEFLFIEAFVVSLLRGNPFHFDVVHDGVVQRLIAQLFAHLNHAGDLMGFAFANEV